MSNFYIRDGNSYFKFKNGREARLTPVNPALIVEVQRLRQAPKPPVIESPVGDGTYLTEENPADPDYQTALLQYGILVEEDMAKLLMKLGVEIEVDGAAVKSIRDFMLSNFKKELDPDDKYVYLRYCVAPSDDEYLDFISSLQGRSKPEEGAIAQALENFSATVQKPTARKGSGKVAPVGN